ncbi:MAG: hypothetical protein ACLFNM_03205 [Candidatus Woesearchaeota archaeon]
MVNKNTKNEIVSNDKKQSSNPLRKQVKNKSKKQESVFSGWYVILFIVLVVGIIALAKFVIFPTQNTVVDYSTYRGFVFKKTMDDKAWLTQIQVQGKLFEAPFYNHPYDLESANIVFSDTAFSNLMSKPHAKILIGVHPDEGSSAVLAGANIARITGRFYGIPTQSAFFIPSDQQDQYSELLVNSTRPVVDCSNATQEVPIIHVDTSKETAIIIEDKQYPYCITVGAKRNETKDFQDILATADYLSYKMLGIMK